jgi:para-nitrobenzyl esterase
MKVAIATIAICASTGQATARPRPVVQIDTGRLVGTDEGADLTFKGIPYAAPPVGSLRWRAPAPAAAWTGTRDASRYGAACPQPSDHKESWALVGPTSEDCLFLNVWRPARVGKYPVMVFLHGGGFTYGAAGVPLYDGAKLARRGVVIVTLNYRLGLLGFFAHSALTRENPDGPLGNYGIMDQIAALRWVQRNVAAFGGDASNVTIFGESAGAGVVQILMGSPGATGLFHKAISESGAGGSVLMPIRGTANSAEAAGEKWAESVGLKDASADQLRELPVEKTLGRSFPFNDGRIVVASPGTPFSRARELKIPLIMGANSNEASLTSNTEAAARRVLGEHYDAFLSAYVKAKPEKGAKAASVDLTEDALSILPSMSIAAMHAANGAAAYDYYFTAVPANLRSGSAGTPHGGEIEYLFGNPDTGSIWDNADRKVSDTIAGYWVRFAKTGDPNGAGSPLWPRVGTRGALRYLTIGVPTHTSQLTPREEEVRKTSLAVSQSGWATEP